MAGGKGNPVEGVCEVVPVAENGNPVFGVGLNTFVCLNTFERGFAGSCLNIAGWEPNW